MSATVLVLDSQVPYVRSPGSWQGFLNLPLGTGTLLDALLGQLGDLAYREVLIKVPEDGAESREEPWVEGRDGVRLVDDAMLAEALARLESSDVMLVLQSRHWVLSGYDVPAIQRSVGAYHGASFGIAVGADPQAARELVDYDANGRVRRIQRLYNAVSWPEVASSALVYALVPARALSRARFNSLAELRAAMSQRGILSSDAPVMSDAVDLGSPAAYLAVHEHSLRQLPAWQAVPGFEMAAPGVLVADGAQVHPSARLVPPVVLQAGAQVGEYAAIIGPALIGPDAQVGGAATVAQSVVLQGSVVPAGASVRHRVFCDHEPLMAPAADDDPPLTLALSGCNDGYRWAPPNEASPLRARRVELIAKRGMDVALSLIGLTLLLPLLVLVAVLVKLTSPGPLFFCHRRERQGGREFPCIKFRTMVAGAHRVQRELYKKNEVDGPQFKMRQDPRVTRVGRVLRATNLDELPQLLNVLVGHMSLVGPRPSPFRENQICVPWRRARLAVRPGITGLWQVCRDADRSRGDFHEWIYYDILYVRHYSFWLDLKILAATVLTLGGKFNVPLSWMIPRRVREPEPQEMLAA